MSWSIRLFSGRAYPARVGAFMLRESFASRVYPQPLLLPGCCYGASGRDSGARKSAFSADPRKLYAKTLTTQEVLC